MSDSAATSDLLASAREWAAADPDPVTAAELTDLVAAAEAGDSAAAEELADAFDGTLEFGTAGLRGRLAAGPNRMNRVVVTRAAAGLAAYVAAHGGGSVVIGYDARRNSDVFARDTAEIFAGAGMTAYVMPRALPTPLLAYAIRPLGCAAGVMVTASHNPPDDNGYKVYLGDGSQIVPPADAEIAAAIAAVGPIADLPRSDDWTTLGEDIVESYLTRVVGLLGEGPRDVEAVYTAMHGVGGAVFIEAARRAGFPAPDPVAAQFEPDGRFPTVSFPNPEEPGAMDLSLDLARADDADIIIANDPDADRCAAGIRSGDGYRMLTGDEVGALLGWWIAQRATAEGRDLSDRAYAASIVSGSLLSQIAAADGIGYQSTLTGFKWISKVPGLAFGYEEALGYCVDPEAVKDKDGISASLLMLELAAAVKAQGRSISDVLDDLAAQFGLYVNNQLSVRVADISLIADAMARLRATPPTELAGEPVTSVVDLAEGADGIPPTDGMRFTTDSARVTIRPSGTEPKLKAYLQLVVPVADGDVADARERGAAQLAALRADVAAAIGL